MWGLLVFLFLITRGGGVSRMMSWCVLAPQIMDNVEVISLACVAREQIVVCQRLKSRARLRCCGCGPHEVCVDGLLDEVTLAKLAVGSLFCASLDELSSCSPLCLRP